MHVLEILLAHVVDYAGLFPPAGLAMPAAAREYALHRASAERWMLGRFVVPATRLDELAAAARDLPPAAFTAARPPWPVSALLGADAASDVARIAAARGTARGVARVESIELRVASPAELERARLAADAASIARPDAYAELPNDAEPEPYAEAARSLGVSLKLRTGGVTPDAFPAPATVLRFMAACAAHGVSYKLTAGLHHPLRAEHPLTYEPGCPRGTMHGFLNVLAAAALLAAGHAPDDVAPLLDERDAGSLAFTDGALRWRGLSADGDTLRAERRRLVSFGSCSFGEPVGDLRALGLLPHA